MYLRKKFSGRSGAVLFQKVVEAHRELSLTQFQDLRNLRLDFCERSVIEDEFGVRKSLSLAVCLRHMNTAIAWGSIHLSGDSVVLDHVYTNSSGKIESRVIRLEMLFVVSLIEALHDATWCRSVRISRVYAGAICETFGITRSVKESRLDVVARELKFLKKWTSYEYDLRPTTA